MDTDKSERVCHYCGLDIGEAKAIQATTRNAWAHVTCWYDGGPFERTERDRLGTNEERADG